MSKITRVIGRQILDSRGNPTVEVDVFSGSLMGRGVAPSGASKGRHEAAEIRDGGKRWNGKGVDKAVKNVNSIIAKNLLGKNAEDQAEIDRLLIKLDGTPNKSFIGSNAIVATSMACARLGAQCAGEPLYKHLGGRLLPIPFMNILNGGMHAGNELSIQEFMIAPVRAKNFREAIRMGSEIYHCLGRILEKKYGKSAKNVGDEGGYAPPLKTTNEAIETLLLSIDESGYQKQVKIAIDVAATSFYSKRTYLIDGKKLSTQMMFEYYSQLLGTYPIISLEDPFHENDFDSFAEITATKKVQIVGDDLLVSNPSRIQTAINKKSCNALLLKINQIGTVTEALNSYKLAKSAGWKIMVSHRSGETEDTFISDFAVGTTSGQIKAGAPARGERTAKYNRLIRIEEELGSKAQFAAFR
ncbi:MAG: phosphopyruvate hydratase [Candidatus Anstonellales archaeon]